MADQQLYILLASYATPAAAEADYQVLHSLEQENQIVLEDAAVLERDAAGQISITKNLHHQVRKGAVIGGVLALVTPVGLLAGVLGGSLAGKATKHFHTGYSKNQMRELAKGLEKGENVIMALSKFDLKPTLAPKLTGATEVVQEAIDVDHAQLGTVFDQTEHTKLIGGVESV